MNDYQDKNGVSEQMKFLRQQPRSMRQLPWSDEIEEEGRKAKILGGVIAVATVLFIFAAFATYQYCA